MFRAWVFRWSDSHRCNASRRKAGKARILPGSGGGVGFADQSPDSPVTAGRAGAPLAAMPAAIKTQAAGGFSFHENTVRCLSRPALPVPTVATGASSAVNLKNRLVLGNLQRPCCWRFIISCMFAGMPGMITSPGFWPALHGPSQRASWTIFISFMPCCGGS